MGIPAFYRWLTERYPAVVIPVVEESPTVLNGSVDSSGENPNGVEFDNLYLDMNGIVHPCFHPEDRASPSSYEEVFKGVFGYIDHLFEMVRPRKLLYMAIDGVAPRAKMNQQRARRFRTAKEAAEAAAEAEKLKDEEGLEIELDKLVTKLDSNVITPGTEFMASLSSALRYYIHLRLTNDPGWRGIKVVLSDANVPGEGEHKIASFIRSQRNLPGFDPNTRHCLYGLDADLIMIALATHEIHLSVLREDIHMVRPKKKHIISKKGGKELAVKDNCYAPRKNFQFLNIWVLREYLENDLRIPGAVLDLEHLIDDFVFICLFVGNDFLPHIPSLEISEGAIDLLINVYKKEFNTMGGYLTNSSEVNLERVQHFLQLVGSHENAIFKRRSEVQRQKDVYFGPVSTMTHCEQNKSSDLPQSKYDSKITSNSTALDTANNDKVKLGEVGCKERYYAEKFEVEDEHNCKKLKENLVTKYVEGICWVMHYYYQGVCSWQWFYPYHYAPFASDFVDLKQLEIDFILGVPFKPFDQLMGVLPASSAHALPLSYRSLMTDLSSSIVDFYPADFEVDLNGKRFAWQVVCKLPFIEESRLLAEIEKVEHTLTDEEKQRNNWSLDVLYVHIAHPLASKYFSFYNRKKDHPKLPIAKVKRKIDPKFSDGLNGYMYISDETTYSEEIYSPIEDMEIIRNNKAIFMYFKVPTQMHIPRPPDGVTFPPKSTTMRNVQQKLVLWHERPVYLDRYGRDRDAGILGERKRGRMRDHNEGISREKGNRGGQNSEARKKRRSIKKSKKRRNRRRN